MNRHYPLYAACSALALALGITALATTTAVGGNQLSNCGNFHAREPVLMMDTTGSTLLGLYHRRLSVFTDGSVSMSEMSGGHITEKYVDAQAFYVPNGAIRNLQEDLAAANAFLLCDEPMTIFDAPMTTVTVFRGGTDALAHTFTYFFTGGVYGPVDAVVEKFIDIHFNEL